MTVRYSLSRKVSGSEPPGADIVMPTVHKEGGALIARKADVLIESTLLFMRKL
jgi:hypothetical protein